MSMIEGKSPIEKMPMRGFVRVAVVTLSVACLVGSMDIVLSGDALAQAKQPTALSEAALHKLPSLKQIALTDMLIKGMIAADKEINAITDSAPEDINRLKAETIAQLDAVAKRNGLANYAEYSSVSENAGLVLGGFDAVTRKYVGKEALIKMQAARIRADKKMSAEAKREALQGLKGELPLPRVEHRRNIDLVIKYVDKLNAAARGN